MLTHATLYAAIVAYIAAIIVIINGRERLAIALASCGLVVHAGVLINQLFPATGLDLGIGRVASLIGWEVGVLWLLGALRRPLMKLGLVALPVTTATLVIAAFWHEPGEIIRGDSALLPAHILTSILAYGLLTIAAGQAVLLAVQERALHSASDSWLERGLPPLEAMETLLFQTIAIGFWLLSCSLLSGLFFVDDLFAQHLVHKTALSVLSWLVFGGLLLGRALRGWRGKTAVKATLSGYVVLVLAYFGSRWVLEILLDKNWG